MRINVSNVDLKYTSFSHKTISPTLENTEIRPKFKELSRRTIQKKKSSSLSLKKNIHERAEK